MLIPFYKIYPSNIGSSFKNDIACSKLVGCGSLLLLLATGIAIPMAIAASTMKDTVTKLVILINILSLLNFLSFFIIKINTN